LGGKDEYRDIRDGINRLKAKIKDIEDDRSKKDGKTKPIVQGQVNIIRSEDIPQFKKYLTKVNWNSISDNWRIKVPNRGSINLDPYGNFNKDNPLYQHKEWLDWVYNAKKFNVSARSIGKLFGVSHTVILYFLDKYNIQRKKHSYRYVRGDGNYVELSLSPEKYSHPQIDPKKGQNRIIRNEHIVKMEEYLNKNLSSEELRNHPCLVQGRQGKFYLKRGTKVHHINFNKQDNRLENLWLFPNLGAHSQVEGNINECFSQLIKLGQIKFRRDGAKYYIDRDFDYRNLPKEKIKDMAKPVQFSRKFEDINIVKEELKKLDWSDIDWSIDIKLNKDHSKKIRLDPCKDCSKKNPLYKHKLWLEKILQYDSKYNLTDQRVGELCGVTDQTIYRWRHLVFDIPVSPFGFRRFLHRMKNRSQVWVKLPKSIDHPFASWKKSRKKDTNFSYILEHRLMMEKELAKEPEKYKDFLLDGKFLKSECIVHHINLDSIDNRLENFFLCNGRSVHEMIHQTLFDLVHDLLKQGFLVFSNGKYFLNIV